MDEERTVNINLETPQDIEAEKAVLGSMMQSQDAVSDVIDKLSPKDFYLKEHQLIYETFVNMYRRNVAIDLTTTYSQLTRQKIQDLVGGMSYLGRLSSDAIVPANAKYYADIVLAKSQLRQLIAEADLIKSKAYDGKGSAEEILDFAEQRILEIAQDSQRRNYIDINDIIQENILQIRELEKNGGKLPGITTGFTDLDRLLGGLQRTDMIILAARPGVGKTSFALNVATNAARAGHSVLVFSMEMSKEQLGQRMLSMAARVDMNSLKNGTLSADDWDSISYAQDSFEGLKIAIDDTSEMSMLEMKNKCRRLKAEKGLDLVVIDYLQLMHMGYGVEMRVQELSAITRNIKILAKELDCAVVLLSQLSRKTEDAKGKRPQLSHLRDSGSIEQDADIVMFLIREDYSPDDDMPADVQAGSSSICEVNIAKHRNGPTGSVFLTWLGRYTSFANSERGIDVGR
ncbi:MAG: replicative DNA helicase [Mogibacterium sp.]|nr:replicative DNA helicase [Mogibacterium sp.]